MARTGRGDAFGHDSDAFLGRARWDYTRQADGAWSFDSESLRERPSRGPGPAEDGDSAGRRA